MLRPTLKELLSGFQRTILEALLPELTSPYAQGQATSMVGMLAFAVGAIDAIPGYDQSEVDDLRKCLTEIAAIPTNEIREPQLKGAVVESGAAAARGDRRAMEAAMANLTSLVVLNHATDTVSHVVRGYVRRHLERIRALLGAISPG